jgi:hypothetical protein
MGVKCRGCSLPDVDNPLPGSSGSSPGRGTATLRLAAHRKWLQSEHAIDAKGLHKTGVNGLIDALNGVRYKMERWVRRVVSCGLDVSRGHRRR